MTGARKENDELGECRERNYAELYGEQAENLGEKQHLEMFNPLAGKALIAGGLTANRIEHDDVCCT